VVIVKERESDFMGRFLVAYLLPREIRNRFMYVAVQKGGGVVTYLIQHCFICRPSDSTVSEDAGIERRIVATFYSGNQTL
jgi:hypothetical protein